MMNGCGPGLGRPLLPPRLLGHSMWCTIMLNHVILFKTIVIILWEVSHSVLLLHILRPQHSPSLLHALPLLQHRVQSNDFSLIVNFMIKLFLSSLYFWSWYQISAEYFRSPRILFKNCFSGTLPLNQHQDEFSKLVWCFFPNLFCIMIKNFEWKYKIALNFT